MSSSSSLELPALMVELLSTCIDAAVLGCTIIRSVQQEDTTLEVSYKEEWDPRSALTRADIDAQRVIVTSLRHYWELKGEHLNLVGEEEDTIESNGSTNAAPHLRGDLLMKNRTMSFFSPVGLDQISEPFVADSLSQVTIYVDPLDGTREFVDGRYENVTCLIGIAIDGKPAGGVIGMPFASFTSLSHTTTTSTSEVHIVYGLVGCGIGHFTGTFDLDHKTISLHTLTGQPGIPPVPVCSPKSPNSAARAVFVDNSRRVVFMTGDSFANSPMLSSILSAANDVVSDEYIDSIQHAVIGGAGKKMLLCAYASCDSLEIEIPTFSFKKQSTYLWDTCAPEAILCAVGGKVTDIYGSPLVYSGRCSSENNRESNSLRNSSGVIASSRHAQKYHNAICQKLSSIRN